MKLGDKMTTVEANIWGDVCIRKTRPPRIGDIPRHVAVDEESPGASSSHLSVSDTPELTKLIFKTPQGDADGYATLKLPPPSEVTQPKCPQNETSSKIPKFLERGQRSLERIISVDRRQSSSEKIRLARSSSQDSNVSRCSAIVSTLLLVKEKLSGAIGKSLEIRRGSRSIPIKSNRPLPHLTQESARSSFDNLSDDIDSRRKDSAVCLEDTEELDLFKEQLFEKVKGSQYHSFLPQVQKIPHVYATSCQSTDEHAEEEKSCPNLSHNPSLSRYSRPRRESSGYFSNLSTFDEDRRNSTTIETLQSLTSLRERRRSSTRMPTTEVYRKISTAGLEMPNIEELKEIRDDLRSLSKDDLTCLSTLDSPAETTVALDRQQEETDIDAITERLSQSIFICKSDEAHFQDGFCLSSQDEGSSSIKKISSRSEGCRLQNNNASSSPNSSPRSQRQRKRMIHQYSSPLSSNLELEKIPEKPSDVPAITADDDDDDVVVAGEIEREKIVKVEDLEVKKYLPKSIKVYQLLSTQSEDRGDGELRLTDRRTSLQINRPEDEESLRVCPPEDKRFIHANSILMLEVPGPDKETEVSTTLTVKALSPVRKLSSPGEVGVNSRLGDNGSVGIRPIYPYYPYSPYGSPQGSPRNRRKPLRESRRVSIDDRQGALQLNQYKLLDNIGQGSFGIVKLAYNEEDETHYAMKILSKKKLMKKAGIFGRMAPSRKGVSSPLAKVYREIALLKKLDHPNVVKLVEVLDDPDEDNLYLVFELVERGEVLQLPTDKPLDEETVRANFRDVVLGVEYLHYQRIVHRDIKPSNLLVDSEGHVKIADLGVSAELRASGELLAGGAGTPAFSAPETTIPGAQYSGTLCDVWSMGVTLYSLVTGKVPWDGCGSIIGVQAAVRTEPLRFPEKPKLSENLCDLISRMLTKDPAMRCTLQEIKTHRWLTNNDKEPLPNEVDNCRLPVTVTDEEVARVVTRVPKLDTLILIKTMLKQHSFQNPFLPRRVVKPTCGESSDLKQISSAVGDRDLVKSKTEQFHIAGRSNSAPDSYDWQVNGRQVSIDTSLPPVTEVAVQEADVENR